MQIVVVADDAGWEYITGLNADPEWIRASADAIPGHYPVADAFFVLQEPHNIHFSGTDKPFFVNSVVTTLQQLQAPSNVIRMNGWNTFLQRPLWEVAGNVDEHAAAMLKAIGKNWLSVKDEPGLIAARVVAMIINEAYLALEDDVSTKAEIDIAMKLGTNYPYGPFEWAELIGQANIVSLLQQLQIEDSRYIPAGKLLAALNNNA